MNFYIVGGRFKLGSQNTNIDHPDQPPECADGIDNESGNVASATASTVYGADTAKDLRVDFGAGGGNETAATGCANALDDSETIARSTIIPNPGSCANATNRYCANQDSLRGNGGTPTRQYSSDLFGNGSGTGTGQAKTITQATGGTNTSGAITVPAANVSFPRSYQVQGTTSTGFYLTFLVEQRITANGNVTGTTASDGSGTVNGTVDITVSLTKTYDSSDPTIPFFGTPLSPRYVQCRTSLNFSGATTETSGTLTGTRYDTFEDNFKVVRSGISVNNFAEILGEGGSTGSACNSVNDTVCGDTSGNCDSAAEVELVITTVNQSTSFGGTSSGAGMATPGFTPRYTPVAVAQTSVAGGPLSAKSTSNTTINVNEGDVVEINGTGSYDPAMRAFTANGISQVGGTPVPALSGPANAKKFVAQDAPLAGNSVTFRQTVGAFVGPLDQSQADSVDVTVNVANVPPTAKAGPDQLVSGGTNVTLTGGSNDPGDPSIQRTYCWTQTGGASVGLPACSPGNNATQTFSVPNADDTLTFDLQVDDGDGGIGTDSVTVTTRATTAGVISGYVTNANTGSPLTGAGNNAKVHLYKNGSYQTTVFADGSGRYEFTGLAGGGYNVRGQANGFQGIYNDGRALQSFSPKLTAPVSVADLALLPTAGISTVVGKVVGDDGTTGIASARVWLYAADGAAVYNQITRPDGTFTIPEVPPGTGYTIRYLKPGHVTRAYNNKTKVNEANVITVATGTATDVGSMVLPALSAHGTMTGTVTATAGGAPLPGIEVRVHDATTMAYMKLAITDASGNYSMTLPPGTYKVWFDDNGSPATYSEWYNGLPGEPGDNTQKIADPVTITTGGTTSGISGTL